MRAIGFPAVRSIQWTPPDGFFRPYGCRAASVFVSISFAPGRAAPAVQDRSAHRIRGRGVDVSARALARLTASGRLASHEVLFPSASAGCVVPWKRPASHDPAAALSARSYPRLEPFAPAVFWPVRPALLRFLVQDVVRRVIHDRVLRGRVPYPQRTFYSQPGRVSYSRQRSWDLILRRFAPVHRVDGVFRHASAPTCRFAWCFAAPVFDAGLGKGLPESLKHLAAAPGVWPRSPAVSCGLPAPL